MLPYAKNKIIWLILLGSTIWSLTMIKSGWVYDYGMGFWGPNGHDGIWHIALINSLARGSFEMPIFAGETIKNYHIGFDLLLAILVRMTHIPAVNLYFQITPPVLAILIGFLTYKLTNNFWSVFFVYFGGSWGWILGKGESTFWSQQAISTLINPPFALSLIFLLLGSIFLKKKGYFWSGICFGLLVQIKIYAVILSLLGLTIASLKNRRILITLGVSLLIAAPIFFMTQRGSTNLLVWRPGWFLETMMGLSDRLNWPRFYEAMINYGLASNWPKLTLAYLGALIIFSVGNAGTRLMGLLASKDLFWISIIVGGLAIPMVFIQTGTPWNTIQFVYYALFALAILSGSVVSKLHPILITTIVLLTLPTTFDTLKHYLPARPPAKIGKEELEALRLLSRQASGTVLTYPVTKKDTSPPRPLYEYESTAYVAAFSKQPAFMEDEVNLNITDFAWRYRRQEMENFFASYDIDFSRNFLTQNKISYIYLHAIKTARPNFSAEELGMKNIFENSQVAIWAK